MDEINRQANNQLYSYEICPIIPYRQVLRAMGAGTIVEMPEKIVVK